jgi:hypothetical protein
MKSDNRTNSHVMIPDYHNGGVPKSCVIHCWRNSLLVIEKNYVSLLIPEIFEVLINPFL